MAKFGIALEWGSRGRWFESSHSDQNLYLFGDTGFLFLSQIMKMKENSRSQITPAVGPSYWIRTSGLLNPIQARYQTSPHPDIVLFPDSHNIVAHLVRKCKHNFTFFEKSLFLAKTEPLCYHEKNAKGARYAEYHRDHRP